MGIPRFRFAPSPTGALHLGSALVALANAAWVRTVGGELILRIDDTDLARSDAVHLAAISEDLDWLRVHTSQPAVTQSGRAAAHRAGVDLLLERGHAYRCFCTTERLDEMTREQRAAGRPPRYDGRCRSLTAAEQAAHASSGDPFTVRLRVDAVADHGFTDAVRGPVPSPPAAFGDFILLRSDGSPTYLLASTVDDVDLAITHVVRGADHLPNTARQIAILRALGADEPVWAHLPLLMREDGTKLSKRDPLGTLADVRARGIEAGIVRAYLAELLGQGAVDLLAEGAPPFDPARIPRSTPRVSLERIESIARAQLGGTNVDRLLHELGNGAGPLPERYRALVEDLRGEHATVDELRMAIEPIQHGPGRLTAGAEPVLAELRSIIMQHGLDNDEAAQAVVTDLRAWAKANGRPVREVLQPARQSLTGADHGAQLAAVLAAVGTDAALARLRALLDDDPGPRRPDVTG